MTVHEQMKRMFPHDYSGLESTEGIFDCLYGMEFAGRLVKAGWEFINIPKERGLIVAIRVSK